MARFTSTKTPLGASETVTFDLDAGREDNIVGSVYSDVAGSLNIEQSFDGGQNYDVVKTIAVAATTPITFSEVIVWPKLRLRYVNGAAPQTVFRLAARFSSTGYRG